MLVEDMLGDLGCVVVGPAAEIEEALKLANERRDRRGPARRQSGRPTDLSRSPTP
jgi:hypothetical protein